MIEPEVTAVLGRRLLAFLIDSSLVAATGLGVAFQQSSAFAVVGRDSDDNALVDPAEFPAIEEMLDFELFGQSEIFGYPVVRAQELGDSYRIFGESSYQNGLLAALAAAVILFGIVPMVLQRTLGMLPLGLGIRKTDGTKAGVGAHLVRTIVGFVDAIPFALPGFLGFLTARASSHRQRLGDRVAKTTVVDIKALRDIGIAGETVDLGLQSPEEPALADLATTDAADPVAAASDSMTAATPNPAVVEPTIPAAPSNPVDALAANAPAASPAPAQPTAAQPSPVETGAAETGAAETSAATTSAPEPRPTKADASKPPVARPSFGDPLPPPPVHRKPPAEHPLGTPSDRSTDPASPSDADDPEFVTASEVEAPTATAAEHLLAQQPLPLDIEAAETTAPAPAESPDRTWQPPREEAAPVWQPTTLETAPIEAPDPHDGRTLDDVERIDPSIGALLTEDASDVQDPDASSRGGKHSAKESSAKTPVWSDKWRAWMYWDPSKRCWLRHDTETNTWQPVT